MRIIKRSGSGKPKYPLATIAFYGPDNRRASKVAVIICPNPDEQKDIRRWFSDTTDIREDPAITEEITAYLKEHGVQETVMTDQIIGCPHEEGIDYPDGGVCPKCSFWWNVDRWTHEPIEGPPEGTSPLKVGRNESCPCGSGKKFKKCCGLKTG